MRLAPKFHQIWPVMCSLIVAAIHTPLLLAAMAFAATEAEALDIIHQHNVNGQLDRTDWSGHGLQQSTLLYAKKRCRTAVPPTSNSTFPHCHAPPVHLLATPCVCVGRGGGWCFIFGGWVHGLTSPLGLSGWMTVFFRSD